MAKNPGPWVTPRNMVEASEQLKSRNALDKCPKHILKMNLRDMQQLAVFLETRIKAEEKRLAIPYLGYEDFLVLGLEKTPREVALALMKHETAKDRNILKHPSIQWWIRKNAAFVSWSAGLGGSK